MVMLFEFQLALTPNDIVFPCQMWLPVEIVRPPPAVNIPDPVIDSLINDVVPVTLILPVPPSVAFDSVNDVNVTSESKLIVPLVMLIGPADEKYPAIVAVPANFTVPAPVTLDDAVKTVFPAKLNVQPAATENEPELVPPPNKLRLPVVNSKAPELLNDMPEATEVVPVPVDRRKVPALSIDAVPTAGLRLIARSPWTSNNTPVAILIFAPALIEIVLIGQVEFAPITNVLTAMLTVENWSKTTPPFAFRNAAPEMVPNDQ